MEKSINQIDCNIYFVTYKMLIESFETIIKNGQILL